MKAEISPVAAGVVIAIIVAIALFFFYQKSGPGPTVDTPMDMKKMMGGQNVAPPASARPGGMYGGQGGAPSGQGGPPGPGGAGR